MYFRFFLLFLFLVLVSWTQAASPHKETITFSHTANVGFGNSVFVVGNHPDLGAWDVTHAIKLRFTSGNVWTGQVAIQAGTQLEYSYISRSSTDDQWCSSTNATYLTGVLSQSVLLEPAAPYQGKTIYYLSGWSAPNLFYFNGSNWISAPMTKIGPGRFAGESLFKINRIGDAGETLEFVFNDGIGNWDNPPGGGNYLTKIDVFQAQDGNVFSYQPPPAVSVPQIITNFVNSSVTNIPGRNVHVYLPRGYTQNTTRRYPVVYFHDGQNVFDSSTAFGGVEWQADETATREISQGRMREAILVGIDNTSARIQEYQPPNDSFQGTQGRADAYAGFVINNVRPYIDNTFRTLPDAKNTVTIGSSMGGLVSLYLGREFSTFGKIGVLSPAFWISPNYITQVNNGTKKTLRVYLDMGTNEGQGVFDDCLSMYDTHLAQNHAVNSDLEFVAGCGQQHNEAAWSARLPTVLKYLLPAREDPPELAQRDYPPAFVIGSLDALNHQASFNYTGLFGFVYTLQRSTDLSGWEPVISSSAETFPWSNRSIEDSNVPASNAFWRLHADPAP